MDDATKSEIIAALMGLVKTQAPDAILRPMYGGHVVELRDGDTKSRIGGIYAYAGYVSFEFAKGKAFDDPQGVLEGTGKHRRHIKFYELDDVVSKRCDQFLGQAISIFETSGQ